MAYSVFAHEAIIDANWEKVMLPLLREKYPGSTAGQLKEAHAYAYGGAVVPDMGYYPFGSKLFTNLIHYVRSGDFVHALLGDAQTVQEYAFALGVLCHYYADMYGHSAGTNEAVPLMYPRMRRKYGDTVTYAEDRVSHVRTEFSFDVLQTVRGNYESTAYHDYIGFRVAQPLLEKAFRETYGLEAKELFGNFGRAIGMFRWTVINFFPVITRTAWITQRMQIRDQMPTARSRNFIYRVRQKNYIMLFDSTEEKPKRIAHLISLIIRIAPKIGPLRVLRFREPGPDAEKLFIQSFDTVVIYYTRSLNKLYGKNVELPNIDIDTGKETSFGEYTLADKTYADLLLILQQKKFETLTPELKGNIISFYSNNYSPPITGRNAATWQRTQNALQQIRTINHPATQ